MKTKHFKKIKAKAALYDVEITKSLFGVIPFFREGDYVTVLAYNYSHACQRAVRRGHGLHHAGMYSSTTGNWARFAVRLHDKSSHWRNVKFFGN